MRKSLLLALALLVPSGSAVADHIGIYGNEAGWCCELLLHGPPPLINKIHIIHKFNGNGATAVQFKILDQSGLFFANAQFPASFLTLGAYNTDLSVAYGSCLVGDVLVGTRNFYWFGNPLTSCTSTLTVDDAPTSPIPGEIATIECDLQTVIQASGGRMWVSSTLSSCCEFDCTASPLPVAEQTWGGIKALYR